MTYKKVITREMKKRIRNYSFVARDAITLLSSQIKLCRKRRKMSELELAQRCGIARSALQRIENGDPGGFVGWCPTVRCATVGCHKSDKRNQKHDKTHVEIR